MIINEINFTTHIEHKIFKTINFMNIKYGGILFFNNFKTFYINSVISKDFL